MKKVLGILAAITALLAATGTTAAEAAAGQNVILAGGKYHMDHSAFEELPFGNGDISYALGYEFRERIAALQLALDFAPDVSGSRTNDAGQALSTDWALTPQANLLFTDGILRGGAGALITYMRDDDGNGEWTPVYWQLILGLHVPPQGRFAIDGLVTYAFRNFDTFSDFDLRDLEYSLWVSYAF
jgi:hypothetical protein